MKPELLEGKSAYKIFRSVGEAVYKENSFYRGTESGIEHLLLKENSAFRNHSSIKIFVLRDGNQLVARFALIHDFRQNDCIQLSFFEAQPDLGEIFPIIKREIQKHFPTCKKVVVGLNGHLNYGAGILLNRFDEVPLFGLPYTPHYYPEYFKGLTPKKMFTYRFSMDVYHQWAQSYPASRQLNGLTVRFMDKKNIQSESAIYTKLNNEAFINHPYWANRDEAEDMELFNPFRFLLDNENLIIAEMNGEAIGFYLWYPDFNQLVRSKRDFNLWDLINYRLLNKKIDTIRFTEIGIIPKYQKSPVALALISKSLPKLIEKGYKYCEGGFIFEENKASIAFVSRILERCYGEKPKPYRQFAVYETNL
jgi:hypothetical protein